MVAQSTAQTVRTGYVYLMTLTTRATAVLAPLLIAALSLTVSACGSGDDAAETPSPSTAGSAGTVPASTASFPLSVTHFRGTTEIAAAPQRIIALDNAFLDYAVDLGGTVVGVSDIGGELVPSYLSDPQKASAAGVQSVGSISDPDLEKIASLHPDLILSSDVRHKEWYDRLSAIAPTVFSEDTGDTWQENYLLTGEALGQKDLARQRLDQLSERAGRIGDRIRSGTGTGSPQRTGDTDVSVVRIKDANTVRLYGEDTFSGSVLKMAGIRRPANQTSGYPGQDYGMYVVSQENLDAADAGLILVSVPADGTAKAKAWRNVSGAVLDSSTWKGFGSRTVDVDEATWMTSVSPVGADHILTDLADIYGVDAA